MRIYEFLTQWVTLGTLFFLIDFHTEWLPVVTLGGLVAGSLLIALWTTLLDRLGQMLAHALGAVNEPRTLYYKKSSGPLPELLHKALVLLGVLGGVYALTLLLPGYTLEISGELITFLIIYGLVAVYIGKILLYYPRTEKQ